MFERDASVRPASWAGQVATLLAGPRTKSEPVRPRRSTAALLGLGRAHAARLCRYGATSLFCLGLSEVTLLGLCALGVNPTLAALVANVTGIVPSYLLSRYWIWQDADRQRAARQVLLYWTVSIASMLLTSVATGAVATLERNGPGRLVVVGLGYLVVSSVLWVTKFALYQLVIFPKDAPPCAERVTEFAKGAPA